MYLDPQHCPLRSFYHGLYFFIMNCLCRLRRYLTLCRETNYSLSEELQKEVQEDFVRMRQVGLGRVTVDDLHAHLVLARFGKKVEGAEGLMCMRQAGQGRVVNDLYEIVSTLS